MRTVKVKWPSKKMCSMMVVFVKHGTDRMNIKWNEE